MKRVFKRKQMKNPGVRFARGATGPYADKISKKKYARSTGANKVPTPPE